MFLHCRQSALQDVGDFPVLLPFGDPKQHLGFPVAQGGKNSPYIRRTKIPCHLQRPLPCPPEVGPKIIHHPAIPIRKVVGPQDRDCGKAGLCDIGQQSGEFVLEAKALVSGLPVKHAALPLPVRNELRDADRSRIRFKEYVRERVHVDMIEHETHLLPSVGPGSAKKALFSA